MNAFISQQKQVLRLRNNHRFFNCKYSIAKPKWNNEISGVGDLRTQLHVGDEKCVRYYENVSLTESRKSRKTKSQESLMRHLDSWYGLQLPSSLD